MDVRNGKDEILIFSCQLISRKMVFSWFRFGKMKFCWPHGKILLTPMTLTPPSVSTKQFHLWLCAHSLTSPKIHRNLNVKVLNQTQSP